MCPNKAIPSDVTLIEGYFLQDLPDIRRKRYVELLTQACAYFAATAILDDAACLARACQPPEHSRDSHVARVVHHFSAASSTRRPTYPSATENVIHLPKVAMNFLDTLCLSEPHLPRHCSLLQAFHRSSAY